MVKYTSLLLIDDDVDDHEIFIAALEGISKDINVATAENGFLALEMLQKKELSPDLIFLDINMPVMNGFQFLSEFKEQDDLIHIPVIMYSTTFVPETIERAKQLGAIDFISKPANMTELEKLLAEILIA